MANKRPKNECGDCGWTWQPRGHNLSARCPECGSTDLDWYWECQSSNELSVKEFIIGTCTLVALGFGIVNLVNSGPDTPTYDWSSVVTSTNGQDNCWIRANQPSVVRHQAGYGNVPPVPTQEKALWDEHSDIVVTNTDNRVTQLLYWVPPEGVKPSTRRTRIHNNGYPLGNAPTPQTMCSFQSDSSKWTFKWDPDYTSWKDSEGKIFVSYIGGGNAQYTSTYTWSNDGQAHRGYKIIEKCSSIDNTCQSRFGPGYTKYLRTYLP